MFVSQVLYVESNKSDDVLAKLESLLKKWHAKGQPFRKQHDNIAPASTINSNATMEKYIETKHARPMISLQP